MADWKSIYLKGEQSGCPREPVGLKCRPFASLNRCFCQPMNSHNTPAVIRSLIIYAACIPLAVWIGYLLAAPADRSTFGYAGIMALILLTPILLRWHHLLLIAGWNLG